MTRGVFSCVVKYICRHPPHTGAAVFWLINKRPQGWSLRPRVATGVSPVKSTVLPAHKLTAEAPTAINSLRRGTEVVVANVAVLATGKRTNQRQKSRANQAVESGDTRHENESMWSPADVAYRRSGGQGSAETAGTAPTSKASMESTFWSGPRWLAQAARTCGNPHAHSDREFNNAVIPSAARDLCSWPQRPLAAVRAG